MRQSLQQIVDRFRRLRPGAGAHAQVAIELRPDAVMAARVENGRLVRTLRQSCLPDQRREHLEHMRRGGWLDGARTYLMLGIAQRQMVSTPRPAVPDEELRDALRWQLRDALDYPPEEAVIDPLPVASTEPAGREEVLVFAVRRGELAPLVRTLTDAGVTPDRVSVIDCAQRNLARHWVAQAGVTALLAPCAGGLLCTVSHGEELILSRAVEVDTALSEGSAALTQAAERVALQLQRTLDLLERRSADAAVTSLVVADWGPSAPILRRVAELAGPRALALPIELLLGADESRASMRPDAPHEFIHLLGACLMEVPAQAPAAGPRPFDATIGLPAGVPEAPADAEASAVPLALVAQPPTAAPSAGDAAGIVAAAPVPDEADARLPTIDPLAPAIGPGDIAPAALPVLEIPALEPPRRRADEAASATATATALGRSRATVPRRPVSPSEPDVGAATLPRAEIAPPPRAEASPPVSAGAFLLVDPAAALAAELARSAAASRATVAPPVEPAAADAPAPAPAAASAGRLELLP